MAKKLGFFERLSKRVAELFGGGGKPTTPPKPAPIPERKPVPPRTFEPEEPEELAREGEQYLDPFTDQWVTPPILPFKSFEHTEQRKPLGYKSLYGAFNYAIDIPVHWRIIRDGRTGKYHVIVDYELTEEGLEARKERANARTWKERGRVDKRKNRNRDRSNTNWGH